MKYKKLLIFIIFVLIAVIVYVIIYKNENKINNPINPPSNIDNNINFDYKVINETNKLVKNQNYLISPLSMGYAISILNEGASANTKKEIEEVLNDYKLPEIKNVKDRIGIANLLFVKNTYKDDISKKYITNIQNKYSSDLIFDDFVTPEEANKWISDKTFKMIQKAIDDLSQDFVLGIANTIAIDVEWQNKFECYKTKKQEFTKIDDTKMNTAYMNGVDDVMYLENENAKGIIKDYKIYDSKTGKVVYEENDNTVSLEYIAILPNNDINEYLKTFDQKELNSLLKSKKSGDQNTEIQYSIPKYTYDFTYEDFGKMLNNLGIKDAFIKGVANFNNMIEEKSDLELFVSKSIHKTHIELSENGTKAAAVTVLILDKNSAIMEPKNVIKIEFNKPFIYIIKDKNSDNIWFFGTVYEPIKWEENKNECN